MSDAMFLRRLLEEDQELEPSIANNTARRELAELVSRSQRLDELAGAVSEMRNHQRDFFGGDRSPAKLQASKAAERKVDKLLAELLGTNKQGRLL